MKKVLSLLLCLSLLWTSGDFAEAALAAPQVFAHPVLPPQFELIPPPALGRIVDYFNASPKSNVQSWFSSPPLPTLDLGHWTGDWLY